MPGRWQIDVALKEGGQEHAFTVFADARDVPLTDRAPMQIVLKGRLLGPLGLAFALFVASAGVWIVAHWAPVFKENGGMAAVASGVLFFLGGVFWIVHLAVNPTMYMANPVQASPSVAEQARPCTKPISRRATARRAGATAPRPRGSARRPRTSSSTLVTTEKASFSGLSPTAAGALRCPPSSRC